MSKKPVQLDLEQMIQDKALSRGYHNGQFIPDPTPVAPPIGYVKTQSVFERVREMVRSEQLRQEAIALEMETFEEADDFDTGEDDDPSTPYEEFFDGLNSIEILDPRRRAEAAAGSAAAEPPAEPDRPPKTPPAPKSPKKTPPSGGEGEGGA